MLITACDSVRAIYKGLGARLLHAKIGALGPCNKPAEIRSPRGLGDQTACRCCSAVSKAAREPNP
jgi:hypothetical protein